MSNNNFAGISFGYESDKIFKERDEMMCNRWKTSSVQYADCSLNVNYNSVGNFVISGSSGVLGAVFVKYWSSAPPTYSLSFTGSGLPYPNEEIAYEKTPNQGVAQIKDGRFQFAIDSPNSYYDKMLNQLVEPHVNFVFCDGNGKALGETHRTKLGETIPFRTLTWPKKRDWNKGPMFYCNNNLPIRNQEQILRDSAYPAVNKEPNNFWGLIPPH